MADAVDLLRRLTGFDEHDRAEIRVGPLQLPSGAIVGLVDIFFESPFREKVYIVSLPTAAQFRAICQGCSEHDRFEIFRLNGATVNAEANVLLSDGTRLRAVEVLPTRLPCNPTELDWHIVNHTLSIIGVQSRCYRSLKDGLPPQLQNMVPDLRRVDCSTLAGLDVTLGLPPLKVIASLIAERDKTLCKLSPQKVADALRTFGIRLPRPRPRVH